MAIRWIEAELGPQLLQLSRTELHHLPGPNICSLEKDQYVNIRRPKQLCVMLTVHCKDG